MKTYLLKAKPHTTDLPFVMGDLIPLKHKYQFGFTELVDMVCYRDYFPEARNWNVEDYKALYEKPENFGVSLFTIRDTGIIVIPGDCLFSTILKENEIETI